MSPASSTHPRGRQASAARSRATTTISDLTQTEVRPLARMLRALGDETRLRIVTWLCHGELCVCHLEKALALSQPNVSRQLAVLRAAGLVESRRDGTWVYYSLAAQSHPAAEAMLAALRSFGGGRASRADYSKLRRSCGPPV